MAERHWELKAIEAARAVLRRKAETYYVGDASVLLAKKGNNLVVGQVH